MLCRIPKYPTLQYTNPLRNRAYALKKSFELSKSISSFAVIVDPLDKDAEIFYAKYGFIELPDSGKMFLPMKTIKELFE